MNLDILGRLTLGIFEILENQNGCEYICDGLDSAQTNEELKKYLKLGIEKIREFSENELADKFDRMLENAFCPNCL